MVRFWDEELKKAITKTRWLIKDFEKEGDGLNTMLCKEQLKKQLRKKELKEQETHRKI